jgi:small neutral amino acid transporter SnatA (MarC family)
MVTLITLLPTINPVSTAFILLGISTHLIEKERNRQIAINGINLCLSQPASDEI